MTGRVFGHLRHNVVAYVALFFALTGGAYAVGSADDERSQRIAAASETRVFGKFKDGPVFTPNDTTSLLKIGLPAGDYVILGKATVFQSQVEFECRIVAGSDFDRARMGNIEGQGPETLTMTVLHSSSSSFTAKLQCPDNNPSAGYRVTDMKITAIRVNRLSNVAG